MCCIHTIIDKRTINIFLNEMYQRQDSLMSIPPVTSRWILKQFDLFMDLPSDQIMHLIVISLESLATALYTFHQVTMDMYIS